MRILLLSTGKFIQSAQASFKKTVIAMQKVWSVLAKDKSEGCDEENKLIKLIAHATFQYVIEIWGLRYIELVENLKVIC